MAITTLAGLKAGLQRPFTAIKNHTVNASNGGLFSQSQWFVAGHSTIGGNGPGVFNTSPSGVVLTSPTTGQMLFPDPGALAAYIARVSMYNHQHSGGIFVLADRLWNSGGYNATLTTAQTVGADGEGCR